MVKYNAIVEKTRNFALRIIMLNRYLQEEKREFVLSKQVLKSGTSIGANVKEAVRGQSRADFYAKMNIALKEASETEYWLDLLVSSRLIDPAHYTGINDDCQEIIKLLVAITKKQKAEENGGV